MDTSDKDFSVDKIKEAYQFIEGSNFYKIYNELNWDCNSTNYYDSGASCFNGTTDEWTNFPNVNDFLKNLYSNLYRIYHTIAGNGNDYFDDNENVIKTIGYVYLKYWLYDQIFNKNFNDAQIEKVLEGLKNHVSNKLENKPSNPFMLYDLKKDEINKIRKIYAFTIILYENANDFANHNNNNSKYMDYFGEGLDEFISSINKCYIEKSTDNYCNEFKEFLNKCKDKDFNTGILISPENKEYSTDGTSKYLLTVEKYENESLFIYLKDKKMLNFLKTSNFLSNKYKTTIAATSVVGSAIGLSSIFYYFYKVIFNDIFNYKYCVIIYIK
ncbi:hypothetical protein PVIIG_05789 [Plasmodium vivax India VII]|uniref:Variable surface protein n=1 Tax=Plasmodium vivax India VII TaxID=1077284 RepID=A0A0J9S385_PLAVI|nr:hypothetical protein PVIIG_05789 [Plasmodium vivax India VII]